MLNLWPFQLEVNRNVWRAWRDAQSVLLQATTGSGKTVMGSHLAKMRIEHCGDKVLFLAHRREIVQQTAKKFEASGIIPGIIMEGHAPNPWTKAYVGSVQTLWSRREYAGFPEAGLLVVDECHRIAGKVYDQIFRHYKEKGAKILLLTATPLRSDGRGLKQYADTMVCAPPVSYLMENGFLVPQIDYHVGIIPSDKGLRTIAGEWSKEDVEKLMDSPQLIGDITATWMKYGKGRRTMCFAAGVGHSLHIVEQFRSLGIRAEHVDGDTPKPERDSIYERSESGEIEIVSSAEVYTEGTDFPWIDCIIHAKKWKSLVKYLQQGGRGMRTYPGKESLLFLDHSGVVYRHGRLELDREWELTDDKDQAERMAAQRLKKERAQVQCPQCGFLLTRAVCTHCGFSYEPKGEARSFLPGVLLALPQEQYDAAVMPKKKTKREYTTEEKQDWYSGLLWLARERGNKDGLAWHQFRERFGHYPAGYEKTPKPPSFEVESWDRHRRIRWAKAKKKEKASA